MKTIIIVLYFFINPLSTVINIIIISIIPNLNHIISYDIQRFLSTCNIETFPRNQIKYFELNLQWKCAGLLGNFLELQKAANLQVSSLIDWLVKLSYKELMMMIY